LSADSALSLFQPLLLRPPSTTLFPYTTLFRSQDPHSPYSGVLSIIDNKFKNNETFTFFGDGEQTRDFVYVKDLVQAVSTVLDNEVTNGKIYNLATGKQISLLEIFDKFKKVYNKSIDYQFAESRSGDIRHSCADIKGLEALGY